MLPSLVRHFGRLPAFHDVVAGLPSRGHVFHAGGLWGSSTAVCTATLAERFPHRTFLVVAQTPVDAERWLADLDVILGPGSARLYPQREGLGEEEPHYEIAGERVETLQAVLDGNVRIVVSTLRATTELTAAFAAIQRDRLTIQTKSQVKPEKLIAQLERMGYQRVPTVVDVAQFAVRGGIVDVYGFGMAAPMRIEWWGDVIETIRSFDIDSQRSEDDVDVVTVLPIAAQVKVEGVLELDAQRRSVLDLIPPDSLIIVDADVDPSEAERAWEETGHHLEIAHRRGDLVSSREMLFLSPSAWLDQFRTFARVALNVTPYAVDFALRAPDPVDRDIGKLNALIAAGETLILCDNEGQLERLEELLVPDGRAERLPSNLTLAIGALHGGFVLPGLAVLTDHEVFRRARRLRRPRRYRQAFSATAGALAPGDYVVHLEHGIGVYRGIETVTVGAGTFDVAVVEYEGGDRLSVPLYKLDQIERFRSGAVDTGEVPPRLDRLGGTRWRKQREKTRAAIQDMAAELLELYARRQVTRGFAFPPDTRWQVELESSFLYEDTPDQRVASVAVKRDMERSEPMDRLIVGDVGYGKTEVAVRAAFKAAAAGKQVAVLVPTTILAEQHGRTFSERLADFPVKVEVLSRFRSTAEQRDIIKRVADGKIDIIVGTHRLLSKDVTFHDLGLLVVDEEQRFGVRHKERLKSLRLTVDILTLTATPIPRTLHQALSGLRNLTLIQTPPRDRSPVLTYVELWDDELLEEALARELDRGGQVYFVHNRIETIETIGERVRKIAPRARVGVGHGQMVERELEKVMQAFGSGELDILVSTMIVESGLDVTNANTMIVHDAQNYGLAQLYQLRGRVGRGHRRAYCLLVVPDNVDPDAEARLKLLEHHTELGSGYWLALRDMEVRGAGNLLGTAQSGHAHAVGFDLYMRWLTETVNAMKGEGSHDDSAPPEVVLDGPAHFPEGYIPDEDAKLDFYRRLARATALDEIGILRSELRDRFGRLPEPADRLVRVFELRALGSLIGLHTVMVQGDEARLKFREGVAPRMARLTSALDGVQFAAEIRQMVPLALKLRRLGGMTIEQGLVRALATASAVEIGESVPVSTS